MKNRVDLLKSKAADERQKFLLTLHNKMLFFKMKTTGSVIVDKAVKQAACS